MEDSLCHHIDLPLCSKFVLKFLIKCGKKYFEIYGCDWTSNFRRFKKISYILFICSANLNIVVILKLRNFSHFVRIINSLLLTTLGQNQTWAKSRGGVLSRSRLFIVTVRSHDQIKSWVTSPVPKAVPMFTSILDKISKTILNIMVKSIK